MADRVVILGHSFKVQNSQLFLAMMISIVKDNIPLISLTRVLAMRSIIACLICRYCGGEWANWLNVGVRLFFIISGCLYGRRVIDDLIRWIEKRIVATDYLLYLSMGNRHRSRVRDMAVCWKRSRYRMLWASVYSCHLGGGVPARSSFDF